MDINDLRSLSTVLVFITFMGICWWAFSPSRKKKFDEAANLPFADEIDAAPNADQEQPVGEQEKRQD